MEQVKTKALQRLHRRLAQFIAAPRIRIYPAGGGAVFHADLECRHDAGFRVQYDRARDAFCVKFPAPFADVELFQEMHVSLAEMARIRAAVRSFGGSIRSAGDN